MSACGAVLLVGFILTPRLWHRRRLVTEAGPCLACVALPIAPNCCLSQTPHCRVQTWKCPISVRTRCILRLHLQFVPENFLQLRAPSLTRADRHFRRVHRRNFRISKLHLQYKKKPFF